MKAGIFMVAVAVLFATFCPATALAAEEKPDAAVNASTKDAFETVSVWVRKQMEAGGRYSYVAAADKSKVNSELDDMGKLLQARGDVDHMTPDEKKEMFVKQTDVNAILAKHDNERIICKNEAPIGSHIPVKTCQTAGMIEARRRNDVQYMQNARARLSGGN